MVIHIKRAAGVAWQIVKPRRARIGSTSLAAASANPLGTEISTPAFLARVLRLGSGASKPAEPLTDIRRFAAGVRAIIAFLCAAILLSDEPPLQDAAVALLVIYALWAAYVLWSEGRRPLPVRLLLHCWIDVTWAGLLLQLVGNNADLLIVMIVPPVLLASIGHSLRMGAMLAFYASLSLFFYMIPMREPQFAFELEHLIHAMAVMALVPAAALVARPINVLRRRLMLVHAFEARLDPRRGLPTVTRALVERLRLDLAADLTGIVLPVAAEGPALLCTAEDGTFTASAAVHHKIEALLGNMPPCPLTHVAGRHPPWRSKIRLHGRECGSIRPELHAALEELCGLLEVRTLVVVPLQRYEKRHGHLLIGRRSVRPHDQEVQALSDAAPALCRILEQTTLVDRLVRETAAHERGRIGRDLHDTAIQPYLGLKYAIEALALNVAPDNPARAKIESLAKLVEGEIASLRDIITGLRNGEPTGDNALVPAVRRQVRHFGELFGLNVHLECPDQLPISRALAGVVFHLLNEALNNVRRHTPARNVSIHLDKQRDCLHLRVCDDAGSVKGKPAPDFFPRSLFERVHELAGTLSIVRPDGLNTEVVISVPLDSSVRD
jgi:signal transduction histidine kinase